jgi:hypothetical protein
MSTLEYTVTDLPAVWPGKKTAYRKPAPFKSAWTKTLHILNRELRHLGARKIEMALAIRMGDLRQDGMLRADARPQPPVIISFLDRDGQRQAYPCDNFAWWQDNVYAIAIVLEDLRRAERYGVQSALLRAGFKALPSSTTVAISVEQAAEFLARRLNQNGSAGRYTAAAIVADRTSAQSAVRAAAAKTHPDVGGTHTDFHVVQEAKRVLEAHHGGQL